ncbi:hypothetical protein C0991_012482, partial [Blastosporella zonata]
DFLDNEEDGASPDAQAKPNLQELSRHSVVHAWEDDHDNTNSWWSSFLSHAEERAEAAGESSSPALNDNEDWLDKTKPLYRVAVKVKINPQL